MRAVTIDEFRASVLAFYATGGRHDLPWRAPEPDGSFDPYKILVSEIMLQQTQVHRVLPKFAGFLKLFPTLQALASVPLGDVLRAWQGLGYNRRAKYLWQSAQFIVNGYGGVFPRSQAELERLPGIGANTAGAIMVYAFDEPAVFIETNIRTVFICHFFNDQNGVSDKAIAELVEKTLDIDNPRIWYWALMDYGASLKRTDGNLSRSSDTYAKQTKFAGSRRQLRGRALRLLATGPIEAPHLIAQLADPHTYTILRELCDEGLVVCRNGAYMLP